MKAIVFDIDGTLIDSAEADGLIYVSALKAALGEVTLRDHWSDYRYRTHSGILMDVLEDSGIESSESKLAEVRSTFLSLLSQHISDRGPFREVPGARRFFEALLASSEAVVAYATGGWGAAAQMKLESSGFPVSNIAFSSSDHFVDKVEIMQFALSQLRVDADEVTYYGDTTSDRSAALELGWKFQGVGNEVGGISEYAALAA